MEQLDKIRLQIDAIDEQIVSLLQQRLDVAIKIAELKDKMGKSVFDSEREEIKLDTIRTLTQPEYQASILRTYQLLMKESREKQQDYLDKRRE